jgi:hypothetical protein
MSQTDGSPPWLFSFVDLAFLLLLALTQLGSKEQAIPVDLGEIAIPHLHAGETNELEHEASDRWQLRVHPPVADVAPYELVQSGAEPSARLALSELEDRLAELRESREEQPLLAPHEDSRSQDLLDAVGLLEDLWDQGRLATVVPEYATR